jgi:hypothetical protein
LALLMTGDAFAAGQYRLSARFFHLGELVAQPMLELEAGVTAAGSWRPQGWGQYTVAALLRPAASDQVFLSLQFVSGNVAIQPSLLVDIGKWTSVTVKKVRIDLLVEETGEQKTFTQGYPLQLTQNTGKDHRR